MKRCPNCGHSRSYKLAEGRYKYKRCGQRYRWRSVWSGNRMSDATTHELLRRFVWGVAGYWQRFGGPASAPATERFYPLVRACMAWAEELREPFEGALECDEPTFGGARRGKRGWGRLRQGARARPHQAQRLGQGLADCRP